MTKTRVSTY